MTTYNIKSISDLHYMFGIPKPKHPLISLLDASEIFISEENVGAKVICDFYMISLKDKSCGVEYGRHSFDFKEGLMVFSSPGQVYTPTKPVQKGDIQGWMLYFHKDLIRNTHLGEIMSEFSFFNYDIVEALHLSESEENIIQTAVNNIVSEYSQSDDNHSQRVIVSNLELLLTYCSRFYERQFKTRSVQCKGVISQFEKEIKKYFEAERHLESGLPSVEHFATIAHLSQHYFSDLIKKETGRKPKEHINHFIIEEAKNMLVGTEQSVSEIAYDLGFKYPHYFTRLFKSKTGQTPVEYRNIS
ncbi:helix-turn-helix domain-containing protein [Flammeovirga aprica]|uniref:Helix-turn-helix transcriptional regulator n=1 Tax=Flammeovirga aprica JL-4 TaxID=694437 RepID=A0A7X9S1G8_9BACT|nr:AraC family transcriptional regulator [Flammeovirga aprica]NME72661.1 helix-turn-helix transcriptional regulator [Flammeovirga aprica JL-4]